MKYAVITFLVIFGLGALLVGGYAFEWFAAPWKGKLEMRQEVQSGDYRKYSYEHFYDLCAAAQRKQQGLESQKKLLDTAETPLQRQRIHTRIAALETNLASDVAQYNADARKVKTKAQFLGEDLPKKLSTEGEIVCDQS